MVRKRGGGTGQGQGQGQGGKRQATTPVGGVYKDSRRNIQGNEEYDEEEEWTQVSRQKTPPNLSGSGSGLNPLNQPDLASGSGSGPSQSNQPSAVQSYAEAAATTSGSTGRQQTSQAREKKTLERKFVTPPPEGGFRDQLVVEIRNVNGVPFKGSLHFKEAKFGIFGQCLHQDPAIIHGLTFGYSDFPLIKFKFKHQINVDELRPFEFFEFERRYNVGNEEKSDILSCKIKGIRTDTDFPQESNDDDPNVRWVKVEWCDWSVEEADILAWLELFGTPIGLLTEDLYPDTDSDTDPTGAGTYSIKMKLHSNIPQLLPMWGKRIRVYHRGIQKLCTNCFGNHTRRNCRSKKKRWIDYVLAFMDSHPDIPNEYYGRWKKVIDQEFGEILPQAEGDDQMESSHVDPEHRENEPDRDSSNKSYTANQNTSNQTNIAHRNPENQINKTPITRLTEKEEEELAEYLNYGMNLAEAREMRAKELQLAEIKRNMREHRRETERGAINSRGARSAPTRFGSDTRRGRGLTFN